MDEGFKTCLRCRHWLNEFSPNKYNKDGLQSYCRSCVYECRNIKRRQDYANGRSEKLRLAALAVYGSKCDCCGETHHQFLTFDHINGQGGKERVRVSNQALYAQLIKARRSDIQVLCWNCHMAKDYRKGCPHNI